MIINVHWNGQYAEVSVETFSGKLEIGLLDDAERMTLVEHLQEAIDDLSRDMPKVVKPKCEHDWRPCYEGDVCDKCGKVVTSGVWD